MPRSSRSQAITARQALLALHVTDRDGNLVPAQCMACREMAARHVKAILDAGAADLLPEFVRLNWGRFRAWGWHSEIAVPGEGRRA